jgi:hypothetical protein
MKKFFLSILLAALCTISFAQDETNKKKLGLYASADVISESIWHGWDISGNKPVYIPYVALDLWGTGFQTAFWATIPLDRDFKSYNDYEFLLKYSNNISSGLFKEIGINGFIDYIRVPGPEADHRPILNDDLTYTSQTGLKQLWKMNIGISLPKFFPIGNYNLIPAYNIYYISPAGDTYFRAGSVHDISLSYSRPLCKRVDLNLSGNVFYHYRLFDVNAWGGAVASTTLSFKINKNLSFNTQIHYQETLSENVNPDNEFWGGAGLAISL